jgi:hypothetical protein
MKLALKYWARIFMASIDFGNHTNAKRTGGGAIAPESVLRCLLTHISI